MSPIEHLSVCEAAAIAQREVVACYDTLPAKDEALMESSLVPADQLRRAVEALEKIGALARNEHVGATHALQNIARLVDEAGYTEHEGPVPCPDCGSRK